MLLERSSVERGRVTIHNWGQKAIQIDDEHY